MEVDAATVAIATGIATAVATVAAVLLSLLWRLIDRERPSWTIYDGRSVWSGPDRYGNREGPSATAELANVGRGVALAVRVLGVGCLVTMKGEVLQSADLFISRRPDQSLVPALHTGKTVHLYIACEPVEWDRATIAVTWIPTPSIRRRRRLEYFALSSIAPRPQLSSEHTDPDTGEIVEQLPAEPAGRVYSADQVDVPLLPPGLRIRERRARRRMLRRP